MVRQRVVDSLFASLLRFFTEVHASPAFLQQKSRRLRFAVASEDPFLVTSNAQYALRGRKIGEIPYLFTDDGADAIKDAVIHIQPCTLILFTPHVGVH